MDVFTGFATYFIIWWVSVFLVLPIGVKSQIEAGDIVKGSERGAPINPNLKKKFVWTTIIATIFWSILFYLVQSGTIRL